MVPLCGGGAGAPLLRMAGAVRRLLLLSAARGSGSQAGGSPYTRGKALAVKKRGYDITRNPHLNKVDAVCLPSAPRPAGCWWWWGARWGLEEGSGGCELRGWQLGCRGVKGLGTAAGSGFWGGWVVGKVLGFGGRCLDPKVLLSSTTHP